MRPEIKGSRRDWSAAPAGLAPRHERFFETRGNETPAPALEAIGGEFPFPEVCGISLGRGKTQLRGELQVAGEALKASAENRLRDVSDIACEDKARLLREYQATTEAFARSVQELQELRGTSSLVEYQRFQRLSEEARIKSEQARLALEHHISTHHC